MFVNLVDKWCVQLQMFGKISVTLVILTVQSRTFLCKLVVPCNVSMYTIGIIKLINAS